MKFEFELSDILIDFACKLINYRVDNDLTQEQLSRRANISLDAIMEIENAGTE